MSLQFNNVTPRVGLRCANNQYVDRFPHFLLEPGHIGTVTSVEEYTITVKMDEHINGCEEWDNEIVLTDDEFGNYSAGASVTTMTELFNYYFAVD